MAKIIILSGIVGLDIKAKQIRAELKAAKGDDVEFHVNSGGGLVFEGIEIFNLIHEYTGHTESRIIGIAASMMSYIVLAADKVSAFNNATFMIHNANGFAIGNHKDMRKTANVLESMSNILVKAYAKKTGKSHSEIKALMDDTTFMFGDEILDEGFINEIIEAPENNENDNDKESALMTARASVEMCVNQMRNTEAANSDFERAVAYVGAMDLLLQEQPSDEHEGILNDPAVAGQENQEDTIMTFADFMAANPTEKVAYDAAIATARTEARTEGVTAAKAEMEAIVAKVSPILSSAEYPDAVKLCGIKAITGEGSLASFEAVVVITDQAIEAAKEKAAADEQGAETAGAGGGGEAVDAEAAAGFDAKKKRLSEGV